MTNQNPARSTPSLQLTEIQPNREDSRPGIKSENHVLNTLRFLGQRIFFMLIVALAIIYLSYIGMDLARGTPAGLATSQAVEKSIKYIARLVHGDLGLTTAGSMTLNPVPVTQVILERFPKSLGLLGLSTLLASVLGILLGFYAALGKTQRSLGVILITLIGISLPSFFIAFLLQWSVTTYTRLSGHAILPAGGFGWDSHLILPVLVLAARPLAQITRIVFVSVKQVLQEDFVRTARSKGLRELRIMFVHVIRNAAVPVLTTIGVSLRFSLSSLPVVELYFGWPGVGFTLLKGIAQNDSNLTVGLALCLGLLFMVVNLVLELSYRVIDPRLSENPVSIAVHEKQTLRKVIASFAEWCRGFLTTNPISRLIGSHKGMHQTKISDLRNIDNFIHSSSNDQQGEIKGKRSVISILMKNVPFLVGSVLVLGLVIILLFGHELSPQNPFLTQGLLKINGVLTAPPFPPGETYIWGTDALGRDMMSLILTGAKQTLTLALLVVAARMLLGILLGSIAGWRSGSWMDRVILSMAEIIAAFPTLLFAMILILAFGIRKGMISFIAALCLIGWGEIMQYVRGQVLSIQPKPFIESAVAVGARSSRIIYRHILPNLFSALISVASLEMGAVLMILGELGFINIFIGGGMLIALPHNTIHYSDIPEWGALLANVRYLTRSYPWTALYPMTAFFIAILSFNLFGEGFRRLVDEGTLVIQKVFNRYTLILICIAGLGYRWTQINSGAQPFYKAGADQFSVSNTNKHIESLTKTEMFGRAIGSPGVDKASDYIAEQFEALGLSPAGESGTYFQTRSYSYETLNQIPHFNILDNGPELVYSKDFAPYPGRDVSAGSTTGPVRIIGLGPPGRRISGGFYTTYQDLFHAKFPDEILMVFSDNDAWELTYFEKKGMIIVSDNPVQFTQRHTLSGRTGRDYDLASGKLSGHETPYMWVTEEVAERILKNSGYHVQDIRDMIDQLPVDGVLQMELNTPVEMDIDGTLIERWHASNVLGYIPGSMGWDLCTICLGKKLIVVLAQYDNPPIGPEGAYAGANDNASGVAVMLEAIRLLQETDYQPYKTFLFIAYNGEGLDGGELVNDTNINRFLQAKIGFASNLELEAVISLRGLGSGEGNRMAIAAGGSLRLAELIERVGKRMGTQTYRVDESMDISMIYERDNPFLQKGLDAPMVHLYWEGWEQNSQQVSDTIEWISPTSLEKSGKVLTMTLMILGRATDY